MYAIVKVLVSAVIIGIITEVARRFPAQGGIIAALPIVSLLSIVWLHMQGEPTDMLSKFAFGLVSGLPAAVVMLVIVGLALQHSLHLFGSLALTLYAQDMIVKHWA